MSKIIRIGTRDSALALWQAKTVQSQLQHLGHETVLVPIKSTGDLVLNKPKSTFSAFFIMAIVSTIGIFSLTAENQFIKAFKENIKAIKTPNQSFLFDHCIYAFQIPDKGFFIPYHGHRSIYDIYKLDCKKNVTIKNTTKDIYVRHFFMTIEKFNIFDLQITSSFYGLFHDKIFRFLTIASFKILIDIERYSSKCSTIIQLLCNNELRKRALNKIRIHYSNKTLLNYLYRWLIG